MYGEISLTAANDHILWNLGASLKGTEMEQRQRRSHTKKDAPRKLGLFKVFQQTKFLTKFAMKSLAIHEIESAPYVVEVQLRA